MKFSFVMGKFLLFAALAVSLSGGCVFNATRITTPVSGQASSAGLVGVSLDVRNLSGNVTITGATTPTVQATVNVSEMAITGSTPAADQLSVSITPTSGVGTVGFSLADSSNLWELLRIEDVSLVSNQSLDVWVKTTSGNIAFSGINGFADLEATSGNITADIVGGCYSTVTSGNIDATLKPDSMFASATLKTTSGNIKVSVPKGFKANLQLSATSGTISAPGGNKSALNGGDSTAVINCSVTSGNITIQER
jgi:hypothetical protein